MPQTLSHSDTNIQEPVQQIIYERFILFGDSITQMDGKPELGFSLLSSTSACGYNTSNALSIIHQILPSPQSTRVRLISLFFGANDAALPNTTGTHVPLNEFKENIRNLMRHPSIQAHQNIKIILITPPPIDEWQFDAWDEPGKTARKALIAKDYAAAVRDMASESNVAFVDLWSACMAQIEWDGKTPLPGQRTVPKNGGLARLLYDGLHISGEGFKVLYKEMKKIIATAYPELLPDRLPIALEPFYPEWYE